MATHSISIVKVHQWLQEWDRVPVDPARFQSAPPHFFYLASIRARDLQALSGVYPRNASEPGERENDPHVQRTLDPERTDEITSYLQVGYPLSGLGKKKLAPAEKDSLRKPGWLPTAIVANIIRPGGDRIGRVLAKRDSMSVIDDPSSGLRLSLPESWAESGWGPEQGSIPPLEIIDGQHRLSAFDDKSPGDFEVPVVIFDDLDFSWQAYLFWTINIKPKRINASLAYDLYPLLREQDWLMAGEGLNVYRETRSQELVEVLWKNPQSVWFNRINMLGQRGVRSDKPVTQSAFIGSLTTTFVRPFRGQHGLGGLFGGGSDGSGLAWPRSQQAAFLVYAWKCLATAISSASYEWAAPLRGLIDEDDKDPWLELESRVDPALVSDKTLLASDQGVRAFHMVVNDLMYVSRQSRGLESWVPSDRTLEDLNAIDLLIDELDGIEPGASLRALGLALASFDWRNSQAPDQDALQQQLRLALRGSGGYNVLRDWLLNHLVSHSDGWISDAAAAVMVARGTA